uniref:ANK_REP_REGION domain-containing protein n=1 Tax=Globodera pallida TaxID=36090 RepID=A0A183BUL8_GLOPA
MRLDVIKHRRVSLKVPGADSSQQLNGTNGLRQRRKMRQTLRISVDDGNPLGVAQDGLPLNSPFSAGGEWRRRALEGNLAVEEVNRWIASGDLAQLETLVLAGKADLLLGEQHKENFIFGHNRAKAFLKDLPEYKEKYDIFLEAIVDGDESTVQKLLNFRQLGRSRHPRTLATAMHLASIFEHPNILRALLDNDKSAIDARDSEGRTALHYAAALAGTLREGVQPDNGKGHQPQEEELECFDILLDGGANEGLLDVEGYSPINFHRTPRLIDMDQIRGINRFPLRAGDRVDKLIADREVRVLRDIVLAGDYHSQIRDRIFPPESRDLAPMLAHLQMRIRAIHEAIRDDDQMTLKQLVDDWDTAAGRDEHGRTPLHVAVLHGRARAARYLLLMFPRVFVAQTFSDFINIADHLGRTAAHYAAPQQNAIYDTLADLGADTQIADKNGFTAARYRQHPEQMVKPLPIVSAEAGGGGGRGAADYRRTMLRHSDPSMDDSSSTMFDPDAPPDEQVKRWLTIGDVQQLEQIVLDGRAHLLADKMSTNLASAEFLQGVPQYQSKIDAIHKAVEEGDVRRVKSLIDRNSLATARDTHGMTPLHKALLYGQTNTVRFMLAKYPHSVNETDHVNIQQWLREGNLAKLDQLVLSGCGDLLLDKKTANPEAHLFLKELSNLLKTIDAIHKAVKEGQLIPMKGLMTGKRLALARDRHGCTPLHTAIIHEQTEIIRFIAATYPTVLNAPDYNKRTAMHYAAAARDGGHYLKILGKAGADPMAVDNEGRTPDYYRRNAVFDLKMMKERDVEEVQLEDGVIPQHGHVPPDDHGWESPAESFSPQSSGVDTGRRDGDDDEEDLEKRRFERLLHEKLDMPTSDNGLYLARTVAPVLTKALAEVLLRRPANPVGFISEWLVRYIEAGDDY